MHEYPSPSKLTRCGKVAESYSTSRLQAVGPGSREVTRDVFRMVERCNRVCVAVLQIDSLVHGPVEWTRAALLLISKGHAVKKATAHRGWEGISHLLSSSAHQHLRRSCTSRNGQSTWRHGSRDLHATALIILIGTGGHSRQGRALKAMRRMSHGHRATWS